MDGQEGPVVIDLFSFIQVRASACAFGSSGFLISSNTFQQVAKANRVKCRLR